MPARVQPADAGQIKGLIDAVKSGPIVYYTPEAAAFFSVQANQPISGIATNQAAAAKSFQAIAKLAGLPLDQVRDAVPVLIDMFPKAMHVVQVRQATFGKGEGSFDDCISTYVMNAKNQIMTTSPFLDYSALTPCENCIEETHDIDFIAKQVGANGEIAQAVFNIRIIYTFYVGECTLTKISGVSLGHDATAWRQWQLSVSGQGASRPWSPMAAAAPRRRMPLSRRSPQQRRWRRFRRATSSSAIPTACC